jgi:TorA maturation chaperone TorD
MTVRVSNTNWNEFLVGEALVLELLGRLLYDNLDKAWLQGLLDQGVFEEIPFGAEQQDTSRGLTLLQKWAKQNQAPLSDSAFDELRADNTRLFVGVGKVLAPLWESVYFGEDRLVFQEETLQVRAWYRRFGLEPEKLHQEPDDHIGLELLFLGHLARLGLQAIEKDDQAALEEYLLAQRQFLAEHPMKWAGSWCALVQEHARTDFYRGLAHLTLGALLAAAEMLEIKMPGQGAG